MSAPRAIPTRAILVTLLFCLAFLTPGAPADQLAHAASPPSAIAADPRYYDIGNPVLTDLWVDPVQGSDNNDGSTRAKALRTVTSAWERIPTRRQLGPTGYRICLVAGTYPEESVPTYWESCYGTYDFPVILEAVDGPGSALLPGMNVADCRYLYLIGLRLESPFGDAVHYERCDHVLIRRCTLLGTRPDDAQETVKINQSQYVYLEDSDISGAWGNAVDFVAVQYGHVQGCRIHNAGDWCIYVKGGSAYLRVEGNEIFDGGTGGFSAGQGSGFEFLVSPWLHYEASHIQFINNVVHDVEGAGMGVNGGYNVLLAYNTLYRVGARSHAIEVVFGWRGCDGDTARCQANLSAGGWGSTANEPREPIPDRNVFIYNNVLYNPAGYRSEWTHFAIYGPQPPSAGTNIPSPARCDTNLRIRGNLIWNGPADMELGVEAEDQGCQPGNPTCTADQLRADNAINSLEPQLVNPGRGDFRPVPDGNVFRATAHAIPPFPGGDRPQRPLAPEGDLTNRVLLDRAGAVRTAAGPPGAYTGRTAASPSATPTRRPPTPTAIPSPTAPVAQPTATTRQGATATAPPATPFLSRRLFLPVIIKRWD